MRFFSSSTVVALTTASLAVHYANSAPVVDSSSSKAVAEKFRSLVPSKYSSVHHRRSRDDNSNVNNTLSLQDQMTALHGFLQENVLIETVQANSILQGLNGGFSLLGAGQQNQSLPFNLSKDTNDFFSSSFDSFAGKIFQLQATVTSLNQTANALQQSFADIGITVSSGDDSQNDSGDGDDNDNDNDDN